jgi:hypothetical protein
VAKSTASSITGSALAIDGAAGRQPHAGGLRVDHEQARACGGARRHDQPARRGRADDHGLVAIEHPAAVGGARLRGLRVERVAAARFEAGEGQPHAAVGHAAQQRLALRGRAGARDHPRAQADGLDQRLDDQRLAAGLQGRHQVDRAAAEAAVGLGQRERGQAQLGEGGPDRVADAGVGADDRLALVEVVGVGQVAADRVGQLLLLFGVVEVHGVLRAALRGPASPWR